MISLRDETKNLENLPSPSDMDFLMEMMELNEEAEEMRTTDEIDAFRAKNNERRNGLISDMRQMSRKKKNALSLFAFSQVVVVFEYVIFYVHS